MNKTLSELYAEIWAHPKKIVSQLLLTFKIKTMTTYKNDNSNLFFTIFLLLLAGLMVFIVAMVDTGYGTFK